jgi:hypothetical protein
MSSTTTTHGHSHDSTHGYHGHGDYAGPPRPRGPDVFGKASHGKIGMWLYLMTDAMTFAGFLLGYALLRVRIETWPKPSDILGIALATIMTTILIISSVTLVIAQAKGEAKDRKGMIKYLIRYGMYHNKKTQTITFSNITINRKKLRLYLLYGNLLWWKNYFQFQKKMFMNQKKYVIVVLWSLTSPL